MTWSYSRISSFDCKYSWVLKYIMDIPKEQRTTGFFAQYGKHAHQTLEKYLKEELDKNELFDYYIVNYKKNINNQAPNEKISSNYLLQGIEYFTDCNYPIRKTLGVEKEVRFKLGEFEFVGYIDVVAQNNGIILTDHKSRNLKQRSRDKKAVKANKELDEYLRQLYLYSIPIYEEYGEYPIQLEFNCFRAQEFIIEPFQQKKLNETKEWALNQIDTIRKNEDWTPSYNWFRCNYICDVCSQCEYKRLMEA